MHSWHGRIRAFHGLALHQPSLFASGIVCPRIPNCQRWTPGNKEIEHLCALGRKSDENLVPAFASHFLSHEIHNTSHFSIPSQIRKRAGVCDRVFGHTIDPFWEKGNPTLPARHSRSRAMTCNHVIAQKHRLIVRRRQSSPFRGPILIGPAK
jgi:hypothetical protein